MAITMLAFFALLFLGVPIAYGLIASSMLYIICFSRVFFNKRRCGFRPKIHK